MTMPAFTIGVFQQPSNNFASWQARGVNTLVQIPTNGNVPYPLAWQQAWVQSANQLGLQQIRVPVGALAADAAANPLLIAVAQNDEPEDGSETAATAVADYAAWKAAAPHLNVFINFDGSRVLGIQGGVDAGVLCPLHAHG